MTDTSNIIAGAYYALVAVFAFGGFGFWFVTRDRLYAWFAFHAASIGALALTFPPVAPVADAVEPWHIAVRMVSEGLVIATVGLLIGRLLLPAAPRILHWPIRSIAIIGLGLSMSSIWFAYNPDKLAIYGAVATLVLAIMITAIVTCIARGSRDGVFIGIALGPLIGVGGVAAVMEALELGSLSIYAEGMLLGFIFELIVVFCHLGMRLRDTMRSRDVAMADAELARRMSETDVLTGLPNRRAFDAELEHTRVQRFTALAILDCDRFKQINDCYGHQTGDDVLRTIGAVLSESGLRAMRIGGEEFGILLQGSHWHRQLDDLRQAITARVAAAVPALEQAATVSIGAVPLRQGKNPAMALLKADEALYTAKRTGRDRLCVYDREVDARIPDDTRPGHPALKRLEQAA